jgi:hypothetical protein
MQAVGTLLGVSVTSHLRNFSTKAAMSTEASLSGISPPGSGEALPISPTKILPFLTIEFREEKRAGF